MPLITANGIELCFQQDGPAEGPSVLLIHGIGCQLIHWPDSLVVRLVAAGFNVVRMDNRDVGLSQKLDHLGNVDMLTIMTALAVGRVPAVPYTLTTMADDAIALLDHLGEDSAHIVGVSMGGMIAQRAAIHHPRRVQSLTSIMSSSGAAGLPPPDPVAIGSITSAPASTARADVVAHMRSSWDLIGGPHFKSSDVGMGRKAEAAYDRGRFPAGFQRQMAAILADNGRADLLATISAPSLVIHGDADRLMPLACGKDVANRVPGARFAVIPQMGHDLPEPLIPVLVERLLTHFRNVTP